MIRPASLDDAAQICEIYNYYVAWTVVTFEEEPVPVDEMARRIGNVTTELPWVVHEHGGSITGYAYARGWHDRSAYRRSVESSIYLRPECTGRGIGGELYAALIARLRERGLHCVIGGIALPNAASIALHEKLGFQKVAHFREVGWKLGAWVDVAYWELLFAQD